VKLEEESPIEECQKAFYILASQNLTFILIQRERLTKPSEGMNEGENKKNYNIFITDIEVNSLC